MRKRFANFLLLSGTILFCLVVAEGVIRFVDDLPLLAMPLPLPVGSDSAIQRFDEVPRAAGVDRAWFFRTPPPLPNRTKASAEWQRWFEDVERARVEHGTEFRGIDLFKAWNPNLVGRPCNSKFFRSAPGRLFVYDPPDSSRFPSYRFLPNMTAPDGLVTNEYGWRGPPVPLARSPRSVRIVFVGASTTIGAHHLPFSYPEYVGNYLNVWSEAHGLGVRFEVMNAARESTTSSDIAAEVRQEVLPLQPDMVIYYDGANQFDLHSLLRGPPPGPARRPAGFEPQGTAAAWLQQAERFSAIARRIDAMAGLVTQPTSGEEWPKPDYDLVWPPGLDEDDPDLSRQDLPVELTTILHDLDRIRADLGTIHSEFAVSSFMWLVRDGLKLDPVRHRYMLEHLNVVNGPYRYRDLARLAAFQNRVFAKYARIHELPFIDVAGVMPFEPDLFTDGIHKTDAGERIQGWLVFQQLVPIIEKRLASGVWPAKFPVMPGPHPAFRIKPHLITFSCGA